MLSLCLTVVCYHVEWKEGTVTVDGFSNSTEGCCQAGDSELENTSRNQSKESVMLVLSRKKNESIVINDSITIVVVEIRGDKVRLGIEAPKEVPVHRREVYEAIKRGDAANASAPADPAPADPANTPDA
jgi:carbon storage regulator